MMTHRLLALAAFLFAAGCSGQSASPDSSVEGDYTNGSTLTLSPSADPDLHIGVALVQKLDPRLGAENVELTLTRGDKHATMPCDNLAAGGNIARGERLFCQLAQGREENEVHESLIIQIEHT